MSGKSKRPDLASPADGGVPPHDDRRSEPRLEILLEICYRQGGGSRFRSGTLLNIGAGGACLLLEDAIAPGSSIAEIVLALPDEDGEMGETLKLTGTVVRSTARSVPGLDSGFLHGLQFASVPPETVDRIRDFVLHQPMVAAAKETGQQRMRFVRPVSILLEKIGRSFQEVSMNLSEAGMFLCRENPPPPGATFRLKFALSDGRTLVECGAEVVWSRRIPEGPERPAGMGIRFLDLDETARRMIRQLIERVEAAEREGWSLSERRLSDSSAD